MLRPPVARSRARQEQAAMRKYNGDKKYTVGAWPKLSNVMRRLNPVCQRIPNAGLYKAGEQCHSPSSLVHHLISPRQRPELFLVPSNLVCLCEQCHPDAEGTPDWVEGKDYVKTELPKWGVG
jgi:5-methylcytosine-specific restriction endonuclease McrA